MSQLPILRVHDPTTCLRWIAMICGAGWLSAGVGLAISHAPWIDLSLMTVAMPLAITALALLMHARGGFKSLIVRSGMQVDDDLHESERNLRLVLNRIPAFVHTITP